MQVDNIIRDNIYRETRKVIDEEVDTSISHEMFREHIFKVTVALDLIYRPVSNKLKLLVFPRTEGTI